jgi:hypothetical protein
VLRAGARGDARAAAVERFPRERLGPQVLAAYRRFGAAAPTVSRFFSEV